MSSTPTGKSAAEEVANDAEVAAILQHYPQLGSDPTAWLPDEHGDLDWSYTSRALRKMSDAELLRLLHRRSVVSIPAREYNPSAPFVQVKTSPGYGPASDSGSGTAIATGTVALPHGYRTPLCFVVKYIWESTLEALKDERRWKKDRVAIFHLWRLCESLLRRADVKAQWMGGMEKTWRCAIFDRLLTRFYKHSARCDPPAVKEFLEEHGAKEYDRDVQKHDWKRWCMRGLNGVQMSEEEVFNGITDAEFRRSLRPADDDVSRWYLDGKLIPFINDDEDPAYTSTSDLTDFDMDEDLSDADGDAGGKRNDEDDSDISDEEDEEESSSASSVSTEHPTSATANGKRSRPNGLGGDDPDRAIKRVRIENPPPNPPPPTAPTTNPEESHYRYIHNHIYPLTRTLAAMAKKNAANSANGTNGPTSTTAGESASAGPSRLGTTATSPQASTAISASTGPGGAKFVNRPRTFLPYGGSGFSATSGAGSGSVSAPPVGGRGRSASTANGGGGATAASSSQRNEEEESDGSDDVIVVSSRNMKNAHGAQRQTKPSGSTPIINGQRKSSPPRTSSSSNLNPNTNSSSTPNASTSNNASSSQATSNPTITITNGANPSTSNNASTSNQIPPSAITDSTSTSTSAPPNPNPPPKPKLKTPTKRGGPMHAYDEHHSLFLASLHRTAPKPRQTRAAHSAGVATPNVYLTDRGSGGVGGSQGQGGSQGSARAGSSERGGGGSQHGGKGGKGKEKEKDKGKGKEKEKDKGVGLAPPKVDLARVQKKAGTSGGEGSSSTSAVNGIGQLTSTSTGTLGQRVNGATTIGMDVDEQHPTSLATLKQEQDVINAKALELLVNLVDAKEVLRKQFLLEERAASEHPAATPTTSGDVPLDGTATATTSAAAALSPSQSQAQGQALSAEEQMVLESKFHDFEGRFNSVKGELMGIVGRLQTLERETREQREKEEEERRQRVRELEERLRMKEEEERQERVERRRREEEERKRELERRRVLEEEEERRKMERKREQEEAMERREREEREKEERERLKRENMKEAEVECRPVIGEMAIQTDADTKTLESRGVQHEEVDVEMGEPTAFFAECAVQTDGLLYEEEQEETEEGEVEVGEKTPKRLTHIPPGLMEVIDQGVQVQMEVEVPVPVRPSPLPGPEVDVAPPRETVEVEIQTEPQPEPEPAPAAQVEVEKAKDESTPSPVTGTTSINLLVDMQMQVDSTTASSAGSETDVDATMSTSPTATNTTAAAVNGVSTSPTLTLKDASAAAAEEIIDPRAQVMTSNLSMLVDNLVSAKMMAVMDSMVKARASAKGPAPTTTSPPDQPDQLSYPSEGELSESHGSVLISTLLDELKAMKEEARVKEKREKEEMEAIRQLHSAEVDALRRRLSYLESQNRYFDPGAAGVVRQRERDSRERSTSVHARDAKAAASTTNGHAVQTPTRARTHSLGPVDGVEPTPSTAGGENGTKTNPTPTPTPSERTYSFSRERGEDDIPLPIKSQRKHHISFPRPHFG